MSGVFVPIPLQNSFIPPPDPVDSTIGVKAVVLEPNCSATEVENGKTVEDPTILMVSLVYARLTKLVKIARIVMLLKIVFVYLKAISGRNIFILIPFLFNSVWLFFKVQIYI